MITNAPEIKITVEVDEDYYCIVGPDGASDIMPYGDRVFYEYGGYIYTCLITEEDRKKEPMPKALVFRVDELSEVHERLLKQEEVEFPDAVIDAIEELDRAIIESIDNPPPDPGEPQVINITQKSA